jgi:hypothetical protein
MESPGAGIPLGVKPHQGIWRAINSETTGAPARFVWTYSLSPEALIEAED